MLSVIFMLEVPTPQRTPVLNEMAQRGIDVLAAYFEYDDAAHGWGEIAVEHPRVTIPHGTVRSTSWAVRHIWKSDAKVLCCFGYSRLASVGAILTARCKRIQVVTRSDSNYRQELKKPTWRRLLKRLTLRSLYGKRTRVWTIGGDNDRYWRSMGLNNRHLIPYGVPNPPVGSREQGEETRIKIGLGNGTVFLNVGMLESWKGTDLLVKAFKDVHDPEARLVIVGKGRLEPIIRSAARDDSRICYLGAQTQDSLGAIYASADVFVLPSRREAWGLVIDEAICNGLRVIASDAIGSASERVTQENGWIFPSEDTNALARIFNDAIKLKRDGWAQLPMKSGYNAAAAMIEDLQHMGVEFKITQESNHAT